MKKFLLFSVCALLLAGCGDNKKPAAKPAAAPEGKPAEVVTIQPRTSELVKKEIDSLKVVNASIITLEQKAMPEFAAAIATMDTLAQLEAMTGIKLYGDSARTNSLAPEAKKFLCAKSPKFMPFFVEDLGSGTIYFAPADAQAKIIAGWEKWFASCGEKLDAPATVQAAPAVPVTPAAPAVEADPAAGLTF